MDGVWGDWYDYGQPCSKSCGGGVYLQRRDCVPPQVGGLDCVGEEEKFVDCNVHECPGNSSA